MSALSVAILQASTASVVAGVSIAFMAYVTGVDRIVRFAIVHPLQAFEITVLVVLSRLPAPRRKHYKGRHIATVTKP